MKLYTAKLSPYAAGCRLQIYAKALTVEMVAYPDQIDKEHILLANPLGKIPVLIDGELCLPESETICEYLEESCAERPMLPAGAAKRARARLLARVADLSVLQPLLPLFGHLSRKRRDDGVVAAGLADIDRGLATLAANLDNGDFAHGPELGFADCALVPVLLFVDTYLPFFDRHTPLAAHPPLAAYWQRVQGEARASRVIEEIQEGIAATQAAAKKR